MASTFAGLPSSIFQKYLDYKNNRQPRFTRWLVTQVWQRKRCMEGPSTSGTGGAKRKGKGHESKGGGSASAAAALQYKLKTPCPLPDPFPLANPGILPRLHHLTLLSEFLSNLDPSEKVPESIIVLLESIIADRKLVSGHYQHSRRSQLSSQDLSHNHAIKVLEDVLAVLRSCGTGVDEEGTTEAAGLVVAVIQYFSLRGSEPAGDGDSIKSQAVLDEDPNDWISSSHQLVAKRKLEKKKQDDREPAQMPLADFLLQSDDPDDDGFDDAQQAAFCFLLDTERLSKFVKETWKEYAGRSITLATATLVTNQALVLLKESESTLLKQYKKFYKTGDHNEIISVMMGERRALSKARLVEILEAASDQADDIDELQDFLRAGSLSAFTQYGEIIKKGNVPVAGEGHFPAFDPSKDREKMSVREQNVEDLFLVCNKLGEISGVISHCKPGVILSEEALYVDTRRYFNNPKHPVPTHLIVQWDFWLHSLHACRQDLMRPCSTALATVHDIAEAARRWRHEPRHADSHGARSEWARLDRELIQRLEEEYDPDSRSTIILRRMYMSSGQPGRAQRLPPYDDLRTSPWAAGCLQVEALNLAHVFGLAITNMTGYVTQTLQLYHGLRVHKQIGSIPFLDSLFSQCVPTIYGSPSPPALGGLLRGNHTSLNAPGGAGEGRGYLPQHTGTSLIAEIFKEGALKGGGRYKLYDALRERIVAMQLPKDAHRSANQNESDTFSLLAKLKDLYENDIATSTFAMNLLGAEDIAVCIFDRWYTLANSPLRDALKVTIVEHESQKTFMTGALFMVLEGGRKLNISPEVAEDQLKLAKQALEEGLKSVTGSLGSGGSPFYASANNRT